MVVLFFLFCFLSIMFVRNPFVQAVSVFVVLLQSTVFIDPTNPHKCTHVVLGRGRTSDPQYVCAEFIYCNKKSIVQMVGILSFDIIIFRWNTFDK